MNDGLYVSLQVTHGFVEFLVISFRSFGPSAIHIVRRSVSVVRGPTFFRSREVYTRPSIANIVDATDFHLLAALYENSRQSYRELGRRVSLSAPAVRDRLKRLAAAGVLQGYMVSVASSLLGREEQLV